MDRRCAGSLSLGPSGGGQANRPREPPMEAHRCGRFAFALTPLSNPRKKSQSAKGACSTPPVGCVQDLENRYVTRLQGIRRQGGTVQVYANIQSAIGFRLGSRVRRDRDLESARADPFAVSAFAGTEAAPGRGCAPAPSPEKGAASPGAGAMMGKRSAQDKLFAADHVYLDFVGRDALYGYGAETGADVSR